MNLSPLDFFQQNLGRFIDPNAEPIDILMRAYPHMDPKKEMPVRMGGSEPARFLISTEFAKVWAPTSLPAHTEGKITVAPTSSRKRTDWMVDVIMSPPIGPFLAVSLGMAASDANFWRLSVSEAMVVFAGNAALHSGANMASIQRNAFMEARDWFKETKTPVYDLIGQQEITLRFRRGHSTAAAAKKALLKIKTPLETLQTYPGVKEPFVMKLASYAANEWVKE